jgi:hypothetical protein
MTMGVNTFTTPDQPLHVGPFFATQRFAREAALNALAFFHVFGELNLFCSAHKVLGKKGAAGVDRQTVFDFAEQEREELHRLHEQLREDRYCPALVRRAWIPKPGSSEKRPLGIPTVRDRVVQTALVHVIEPLDVTLHEREHGFRHGRLPRRSAVRRTVT